MLILGFPAILAGTLALKLPETRGLPLPETLQEAIEMKQVGFFFFFFFEETWLIWFQTTTLVSGRKSFKQFSLADESSEDEDDKSEEINFLGDETGKLLLSSDDED